MKHGFADVRDKLDQALMTRIRMGESLSSEEISKIKLAVDLGDTCGCDNDHHGRDYMDGLGSRRINVSK